MSGVLCSDRYSKRPHRRTQDAGSEGRKVGRIDSWLAACSARVWEAPTSKVSTTLLGATVAVAADPGLLPLPSSEDCVEPSPDEEAELLAEPSASDTAALGDAFAVAAGSGLLPRPSSSLSPAAEAAELLAEASGSDAPSLEAVAATDGSGPSSDSDAAAELLAAPSADSSADAAADVLAEPSADSSADAAADVLAEPSGSDTASHGDAFSDTVAATEALALGEGLAATLEDIAAGPRRGASGARRSSPKEGYAGG